MTEMDTTISNCFLFTTNHSHTCGWRRSLTNTNGILQRIVGILEMSGRDHEITMRLEFRTIDRPMTLIIPIGDAKQLFQ